MEKGLETRVFTCIVLYSELVEQSGLIGRPGRDVELQPHR
jgi:hypothetical protein